MQETGIFQNYAIQSLLDELDVIEYFENPNYDFRVGETISQIYKALDINPQA